MIVKAPEGSRWYQHLSVGKCGCVINGVMEINPERTQLLYWRPIGKCKRHSADTLLDRVTQTVQRWSRTGLDGGRLMLMEGGSLQFEDGNVVARVPVVFRE